MPADGEYHNNQRRGRGRPRAYDRVRALRQVSATFWKKGYAATSLDNIAVATGMNRPSLRAAFGDKHAMYVTALNEYWQQQFAAMQGALELGGSVADGLMRVYEAALALYFDHHDQVLGCFVLGTALTEAPGDPEIKSLVATGLRTLDDKFEKYFQLAATARDLPTGVDPHIQALLASATMHTLAVRARAGSSRTELRQLAGQAIGIIWQ